MFDETLWKKLTHALYQQTDNVTMKWKTDGSCELGTGEVFSVESNETA